MAFALESLVHPIVQAPMAGGPSTPALAAAVSGAGGLGFLAAGYQTIDAVRGDLEQLRSLAPAGVPFGLNLFAPPGHGGGVAQVAAYANTLRAEAERGGTALGAPRWDDDRYAEKLDLVCAEHVPVVSFTFGCPPADDVRRLRDAGVAVWVTVTTAAEALAAHATGVDALIAQGVEAGGHRGTFDDAHPGDLGLLALLQLVRGAVGDATALVATGGIVTGRAVAAVLAAGATAAQLGTAFMLCPEAATAPAHRCAIADGDESTALTRAFTGRAARGIVNRFLREHSATAPSAYPEVHHLTAPIRAAARQRGDAGGFNLWAGQAYPLASAMPAGELVVRLASEARAALADALRPCTRPRDAARMMHQPTAEDALQELEPLVGEWSLEAIPPGGKPWPGDARATIEWHDSGAHLVQRSTVELPEAPNTISIIGCDAASGAYYQLYSDDRGVCRIYEMSIGDGEWRLWREGDPFAQRFTARFEDDGNTIVGRWERADDGTNYELDFDLIYRRAS